MAQSHPPLNYQASAGQTNLQVSSTLPPDVVQCLKNARFLHLATCTALQPHVSLMNYTYLPSTPYSASPVIIMTTNPASRKTHNLISNPNVSLLVHDWVSHRPPTTGRAGSISDPHHTNTNTNNSNNSSGNGSGRAGSPPAEASRSSLATLLANLNTSALSSISATINGQARLVDRGTEEEGFLREAHLENNTFGERAAGWGEDSAAADASGDGGRGCFIEGEEVRVVVVRIRDGRVADWKGAIRDWVLGDDGGGEGEGERERRGGLVNGV